MTQTDETAGLSDIAARIWGEVGGPADRPGALTVTGPRAVLPSPFDVTGLATASVAAATMAAAEFLAVSSDQRPLPVTVDSRQACAAFAAEGLFTPVGWERPDVWDPIAGNYQARDGWIRLHTNYAYHRAAVERLLGATDRESVLAAVAEWKAEELETAVVEAGGCAAVMRTREDWLATPPARPRPTRRWRPSPTGRCRPTRVAGTTRAAWAWCDVRAGRTAAVLRPAGARPHPGHRRAGRHQVPGRLRRRRAPDRPARVRRGARAAAGDDGGQADRRARPHARRRAGRPSSPSSPAPTCWSPGCARTRWPARLRRRGAGRPEPGPDRGLARRLRVGRTVAGPARIRQPGADERGDRGGRRRRDRGGPAGAAARCRRSTTPAVTCWRRRWAGR